METWGRTRCILLADDPWGLALQPGQTEQAVAEPEAFQMAHPDRGMSRSAQAAASQGPW